MQAFVAPPVLSRKRSLSVGGNEGSPLPPGALARQGSSSSQTSVVSGGGSAAAASAAAAAGEALGLDDPSEKMTIMPLGGGQEVGRSCIVVSYRGCTVMLDCGLHTSRRGLDALPFLDVGVDLQAVDLLLVRAKETMQRRKKEEKKGGGKREREIARYGDDSESARARPISFRVHPPRPISFRVHPPPISFRVHPPRALCSLTLPAFVALLLWCIAWPR